MKSNRKNIIKHLSIITILMVFFACQPSKNREVATEMEEHEEQVFLSAKKIKELRISLDTLQQHIFHGVVYTNGRLEVPPQFEATITAMLGGNISQIEIIEGEVVKKGQLLAYLQHPSYITLQTDYMKTFHQDKFLTDEFERQKKLKDAEVGAKKDVQRIESELLINKADLRGYEAQLQLFQLDLKRIQNGEIYNQIPVFSPIDGSIEEINVQLGQYVDAQTKIFRVVNTKHVHADFMVFENDVMAVQVGQKVKFTIGTSPKILNATIISIGKQFENNPKALHIHADIDEEDEKGMNFISGMYIKGEIYTESVPQIAVPETAVISENGRNYIFYVQKEPKNESEEYQFAMLEVQELRRENNWIAINLLDSLPNKALIVQDGAYYLISEMKKDELDHDH